MRLVEFGVIGLNGTVRRPEPGADFQEYQNGLATYQNSMSLRKRMNQGAPALDERMKDLAEAIRRAHEAQRQAGQTLATS